MTQPTPQPARGFTLIEVMVAVSIIVLMIALALPAFRAITGSRSSEGATNQIVALLGRARTDAVGVQQPRGVAFYTDTTGQCHMAEVGPVQFVQYVGHSTAYSVGTYVTNTMTGVIGGGVGPVTTYGVCIAAIDPANPPGGNQSVFDFPKPTAIGSATDTAYWHIFTDKKGNSSIDPAKLPGYLTDPTYLDSDLYFVINNIFYDVLPDVAPINLPLGVGAQVITDSSTPVGGTRASDGYLRAGAVVFDAAGRVAYLRPGFVFSHYGVIGRAVGLNNTDPTADNIAINTTTTPPAPKPLPSPAVNPPSPFPLPSSFGLVVYDRDAFDTQGFPKIDPTFDPAAAYGTVGGKTEADAEAWLDANSTPLLLNRYNGTLVRGE